MGGGAQQIGDEGRSRDHLLKVIQDEEEVFVAHKRQEAVAERLVGRFLDPKRGGKRGGHEQGVREGRELDEPDAVREIIKQIGSDL